MKTRVISCSRTKDNRWWVGIAHDVVHKASGLISSQFAYFKSSKRHAKGTIITFPKGTTIVTEVMTDKSGKKIVKNGRVMQTGRVVLP